MSAPVLTLSQELRHRATTLWHIQRVKRLVRDAGQFGSQTIVSVTEVICDDPDCPGPATRVTIVSLDLVRRIRLIHRPLPCVTAADVAGMFR